MSRKGEIFRVAAVVVGIKIAYLLLILFAAYSFPDYDKGSAMRAMMHWPRDGEPVFASHFATWDAAHYLYLSEVGYKHGAPSCAFYPLWPMSIRSFSLFTGGNHVVAGTVLANVFSCIAWVMFYVLVKDRHGVQVARLALAFLIIFPGSLFFQFAYTESLFFLLLMGLWWGLEKDRPVLILCSSLLLPLTRAIGIFCFLPIFWHLFGDALATLWKSWLNRKNGIKMIGIDVWPIVRRGLCRSWLLLAPFLGWGAYFLFIWSSTGNAFEGFSAQRFWGAHSMLNIINVPKFMVKFFQITDFHSFSGSFLDRCVFVLLFWSLFRIWKLGKDLSIWALILGVVPAMSGDLMSFTRFCSIAFPLFIALAVYLTEKQRPWQKLVWFEAFAVLHMILAWRFINFQWAG